MRAIAAWLPRVELISVLANYGNGFGGKLAGDVAAGAVIASEPMAAVFPPRRRLGHPHGRPRGVVLRAKLVVFVALRPRAQSC